MFANGGIHEGFSQTLPKSPGRFRTAIMAPSGKSAATQSSDSFRYFCKRSGAGDTAQLMAGQPSTQAFERRPVGYRGRSLTAMETKSSHSQSLFENSMHLARWLSPQPSYKGMQDVCGVWPPLSRGDAALSAPRELLPVTFGDARRKLATKFTTVGHTSPLPQVRLGKIDGQNCALPKGISVRDVADITQGMRTRGKSGRCGPHQLAVFPGEVISHYGPGT